ncbi:type III polyketide synthase [Daejeonella oryzae]|uniref:type III polyketide synthase n=1 Tax=Daejeonella oryzae TaxID=1122943 RepID=UPI0004140F5A|nr:type III polyketide synthase [Daejeonella oryzae]
MNSCISAIGTANPKYRIPQNDIYGFMVKAFDLDENNASRLKKIYDHSGIEHRYSVIPDFGEANGRDYRFFNNSPNFEPFPSTQNRLQLYQHEAAEIAAAAAKNCIDSLTEDLTPKITHLITVSCTGMHAPGIDIELVEILGLKRNIERTCINFMGCYGALNALKVADYICRADTNAKVLIVCIELCTLHFQKENTLDNWVANSLFSDGAAAVIVENNDHRTGNSNSLTLDTFYSEFVHEARSEMGWYVGNAGFEMKLTSKVSKLIKKHIYSISDRLLEKAGLAFSDIGRFAVHPGGRKILEAAESALGFSSAANQFGYETLRDFGNMSSATVLFVLKKLLDEPNSPSGENILGFAFGPGLTVESMILKRN